MSVNDKNKLIISWELELKPTRAFKRMLKHQGYSDKTIDNLWKWYDYTERK